MAAQLNHTIVWSSNQRESAKFLADMLGLPAPTRFGPFEVVELDADDCGAAQHLLRSQAGAPP